MTLKLPWLLRWQACLSALLFLAGEGLSTAAPSASTRHLLVIETSSATAKRQPAIQSASQSLLKSAFNGQLKRGDTLGVWTFGDSLSRGVFPLQRWENGRASEVSALLSGFLKDQKYAGTPRWESVAPTLAQLAEASDALVVVLLSSGETNLTGTPFDDEINAFYARHREEQLKERKVFITVLRSAKGRFSGYTVNQAQWSIEFPPPPAPAPASAQVSTSAPTSAPPRLVGAPLILSGPKRPPIEVQTNSAPVEAPTTNAPLPVPTNPPAPAVSNPSAPAVAPEPAAPKPSAPAARTDSQPNPRSRGMVWLALAGGGVIAVFGMVLVFRRQSGRTRGSLITQSVDRSSKPRS